MAIDRQRKIEPEGQLFVGFLDLFIDHLVSNLGDLGLSKVNNQDEDGKDSNKGQGTKFEVGGNLLVAGLGNVANANVGASPDQASPEGPDNEGFVAHGRGPSHNRHKRVENWQEAGDCNRWPAALFNEDIGSLPVFFTKALA